MEHGKSAGRIHWPLLLVTTIVAGLGTFNLHSAAAAHDPRLYLMQLLWFGLGLLIVVLMMLMDYRLTEMLAYLLYGCIVLLLLFVLLKGKSAMGARRWLIIGSFTFQPSEIAKLATIFCLARYFSQRIEPTGYTLTSLIQPFNMSRPLLLALLLAKAWRSHFLQDPIGSFARLVRQQLGDNPPVLEDLLWFRILLGLLLLSCCLISLWLIVHVERHARLLNPWPQGRRRRLLSLTLLLFISLGLLILTHWGSPWLADPFGMLLTLAYHAGASDGMYGQIQPGIGLRLVLSLLLTVYFSLALFQLIQRQSSFLDSLIAPLDLLLLPALLILVEPDLGTAMIVVAIGMTMILVVGIRPRSLLLLSMLGALISCVAWFGVLKDYQKRRILTFIDPEQDIRGAGWNAVQSFIAVGSGRWWGKGHLGGTQTQLSFLPEQHTDFAFSVWAEEQGFMGCLLLIGMYMLLLAIALAIASEARDNYGVLLATGVAALIMWQAFINIGMVIGLLPVVGITLPLFSYGGSSVMTVMVGIGLLMNVYAHRRTYN